MLQALEWAIFLTTPGESRARICLHLLIVFARRDFPDEISSVAPPPATPTKVFDGFTKGLPVIPNPPVENYTTNFLLPVAERSPDFGSSSDESSETALSKIFASDFEFGNLPGRSFR